MALAILNTSIITADGNYTLKTITLEQALGLLKDNDSRVNSAVGHESTAQILTTLLGVEVPVNRQMYSQAPGETALVFKLNGRAPEGTVLSLREVEDIGYSLKALCRHGWRA